MPEAAPSFSILIVNYNAGTYLERCLAALRAQSLTDFEVIVVDNDSHDDSLILSAEHMSDPRFRVIRIPFNAGFAAGNNRAAELARGEWLVTLNPDAFPERGWLAALAKAACRYPDVDMFGSTQLNAANPHCLDGVGDAYLAIGIPWRGGYGQETGRAIAGDYETFAPCAAAAMYRASVFRIAGGFDESFFCYIEDADLAFRLRLLGKRCVQVHGAVVHHVGGATSDPAGRFARYHGTRNLVWAFIKNMPGSVFWPMLPLHAVALSILIAKAAWRGDVRTTAGAFHDAICGLPAVWRRRREIQSTRLASTREIVRALCWNPGIYFRRDAHVIGPAIRNLTRPS